MNYNEFEKHFSAKAQPKQPMDVQNIIIGAMVGFLFGLFVISLF